MKFIYTTIVFMCMCCLPVFQSQGYCASNETRSIEITQKEERIAEQLIEAVSWCNYDDVLNLMNNGADINAKTKYGRTALQQAVSNSNYNFVKFLIEHGANVNFMLGDESLLYMSVEFNSCLPLVKLLVENGADVNATNAHGETPLMALSKNKFCHQTIKYLLSKGANAALTNNSGQTALDIAILKNNVYAAAILREKDKLVPKAATERIKINRDNSFITQFQDAIEKDDVAGVETLIKSGADVDSVDSDRNSPLFYAVKKNNYKISKILIENWADVNCYSYMDSKILREAISNQNIELSKLLIENGAIITLDNIVNAIKSSNDNLLKLICENNIKDILKEKNEHGQSINLDAAVESNIPELIKTLVTSGVDVNYRNTSGSSWLSSSCKLGYYDMAKTLIELGANINLADNYGMTPIIFASWYGHSEIVKLLIDHGAEVNAKTIDGTSALMFAASAGNSDVIKLLIDKGAKIEAKNNNGVTAAMEALTSSQTEALSLLKSKGADIAAAEEELEFIKKCGTNINEKDEFGVTLLIVAANENNMKKVKMLIDRGADVCYKIENNSGYREREYKNLTALYYAAMNKNEAMMKLLIEKGALPDRIDEKHNPILVISASSNNYSLIKYLIDKKFNVNEYFKDETHLSSGVTPIIAALGNPKIMELLIRNGADLNQSVYQDFSGEKTPLIIAVRSRDHSSFNLLVKNGADINFKIAKNEIMCETGSMHMGYFPDRSVECAINEILSIKTYSPKFTLTVGNSALREAVEVGDVEIIKSLRKMGADIKEKNAWGWTYLMLSIMDKKI